MAMGKGSRGKCKVPIGRKLATSYKAKLHFFCVLPLKIVLLSLDYWFSFKITGFFLKVQSIMYKCFQFSNEVRKSCFSFRNLPDMHKYLNDPTKIYRFFSSFQNFVKFSEEVSESLSNNKPLVALESTVITHGLPYPENLKSVCQMEHIVRQGNATPAVIGVIKGNIHIGMNKLDLEDLAKKNMNLVKISKRDLPFALSKHFSGGTTVAATMALAYRAGISVFATGGIGGVHRGAEITMDVSADLHELSRTPITVVSAGVKSILDIGRTLEYLETLGVCVASFGASKDFPSFFTPKSNFKAPYNVESFVEAARLIVQCQISLSERKSSFSTTVQIDVYVRTLIVLTPKCIHTQAAKEENTAGNVVERSIVMVMRRVERL
ncbi:pseudouridine-5'-phosphate glycosidase [Nephila pilipes]|uniref:Pseudouridine-5'-phosphate glycosidase n=1 Tax=Nephila pilipes TaxID=299642 RepID=A0A8X6TKZ1_NEPPI|nr:pseudouridine-5'-phosphate glycosidase [Nephila pilipes]